MQSGTPRRRPMAMRIVLSSMRRPREVTRRVCNQEPDSFLEADKSLALDKGSGAVARSSAAMEETLGRSHDFCRCDIEPEVGPVDHSVMAESQRESGGS